LIEALDEEKYAEKYKEPEEKSFNHDNWILELRFMIYERCRPVVIC
jgi:hypothetical protein